MRTRARWFRREYRIDVSTALAALIILCLIFATRQRNDVWGDEIRLWQDTVNKSPEKPRPRMNLAWAHQNAGHLKDALHEYQVALALANRPDVEAREKGMTRILASTNVVKLFMDLGRFEEAANIAVPAWNNSGYPGLAVNLSTLLLRDNRTAVAIQVIDAALTKGKVNYPWFPDMDTALLHFNKAEAYRLQGDCAAGLVSYREGVRLNQALPVWECP